MNSKSLFSLALLVHACASSVSCAAIPDLVESFRHQVQNVSSVGASSSPLEIRMAYKNCVSKLSDLKEAIVQDPDLQDPETMTTRADAGEVLARTLHGERRKLGEVFKKATPWVLRQFVYARNWMKYNDIYGPTYESLIKKGKTTKDIAESAMRTGGEDLGLTSPLFLAGLSAVDAVVETVGEAAVKAVGCLF